MPLNKCFLAISVTLIINLFFSDVAVAEGFSLKVETPKSTTNINNFKLSFVTMDINGHPVTVKCYKQSFDEVTFSQFGPDIALVPGGSSGDCLVDSSVLKSYGKYNFKISATNGNQSLESDVVNVEYAGERPGNPYDYIKDRISACQYKINFKTAADNGKTSRVEIYRSQSMSFMVAGENRLGEMSIRSDQKGEYVDTLSDCDKEHYYAVRAYDNAGNGSDVIGDREVNRIVRSVTVYDEQTGEPDQSGAIEVTRSQLAPEGDILGETTKDSTKSGEVLSNQEDEIEKRPVQSSFEFDLKSPWSYLGLIGLLMIGIYAYRRYSSARK